MTNQRQRPRLDANAVDFRRLSDGFDQARLRYTRATKTQDPNPAFFALFEALNWAVVLDDRVSKHWAPDGTILGWDWRQRLSGAELMGGLRFVRNTVHHDWSDALRLESGRRFPMTFPVVFFSWVWRPVGELSLDRAKEERSREKEGREAYEALLSGQSAEGTLLQIGEVFDLLGHLLEPIPRARRQ